MAEGRMGLLETLRKATADGDVDLLREGVRVLAQAMMDAEVSELTRVPTPTPMPTPTPTPTPTGSVDAETETPNFTLPPTDPNVREGQANGNDAASTLALWLVFLGSLLLGVSRGHRRRQN